MIERRPRSRRSRRRGFGLIELAISGLMIAVAMTATVQVVGWVALTRRAVARRERAVVEAANLMERASARPFHEITDESLRQIQLPEAARSTLPGSELSWKLATLDDAPPRKRITIEIRWRDRAGQTESPVRLVAWSYREGGSAR